SELVIAVTDNGIGIPPDKLAAIFDLFVQLDHDPGRGGGLGIGLALTRQIVALHRGTIAAQSDGPGHGSTFVVRLPLPEQSSDLSLAPEKAREARPCRVLVADDNSDAAESLVLVLQLHGHSVQAAPDGEAAFQLASAFQPDVAILDIGMPRLDGYAL